MIGYYSTYLLSYKCSALLRFQPNPEETLNDGAENGFTGAHYLDPTLRAFNYQ
jgi:hypothetical protein